MIKYINNNKKALIVLPEIYGINKFMEDVCFEYHMQGFDVFCPNMLQRTSFLYSEGSKAYQHFINTVGFDFYIKINQMIDQLKLQYKKVFIIGFSVGATIAWRCCENLKCDGIIGCYGSRIRDYLLLQPYCPVLLLFAEQDSFDVNSVIKQLEGKSNVEIYKLKASHGFMDQYSKCFSKEQARISKTHIGDFFIRNK